MSEAAAAASDAPAFGAEVWRLLEAGSFSELLSACETLELSPTLSVEDEPAPPSPDQVDQQGLLCAVHLLAYLLTGQLDSARFLWKRTPAALQEHAQAAAAHRVLAARWRRQYDEAFAQLNAGTWDARLQPLVTEVVARSRSKLLDQISNAYKVIAVERVGAMLGLDAAAARTECEARGWEVDASGNALPTPVHSSGDLMQMGESQLQKLAEYMAHLEQAPCRI
eukprot:gb/GFBE01066365.1/.p1 GENE.gb/GFBE01066365.1/~~gb/GFBE01066365.1/.p1  ORF type:complete len:224 (+),score=43.74 gb/GFBE01066365.1/:1-672(+)